MKIYPSGTLIANRYEVVQGPHEKPSLLGGMGIVYLCLDRQEDRPVALKTFQPQFLPDRAARDRFLREGTTWLNLGRHPHIVHCYDVKNTHHGQEVFLILEQVAADPAHSGASLRDWLQPGQPLPLDSALLICLQIVRGLSHAVDTQPGFVHRDLKPGNVLVGADTLPDWPINRVRVTDFGLVTSLNQAGLATDSDATDEFADLERTQLTRGWLGTPLYMAPEQWNGEAVTTATDVYALGLILYEMVVGHRAISAKSLTAIKQAHLAGKLKPLPKSISEPVADLIRCCVATNPADRYSHWLEVESAIAQAYQALTEGQEVPLAVDSATLNRAERIAQGWAKNSLGLSYRDIGKFRVAISYFEQVQSLGESKSELTLRAAGLGNLGNVYLQIGDVHRAISYHEKHLIIAQETGDRISEGLALGNLGSAYGQLRDARRAISYLEQSLTIVRETRDRATEGKILGNLGLAYSQLGDVHRAINYHKQQLVIAQETGDRVGEGTTIGSLGLAYDQLGDAHRAISYYEQQLAISQEIGNRFSEGKAVGNLGIAYSQLGNSNRAIGYLQQQLAISQEIGDQMGEGKALGGLGTVYAQMRDVHRAISFFEQQLAIAQGTADRVSGGEALGNLGRAYFLLGDDRRAISFYEQALIIAQEANNRRSQGSILANMALLQAEQGNISQAVSLAQEAAEIFDRVGQMENAQRAQQLVAQLQSGANK